MRSHASRGSPALSLLWTFYSGTYSLSCLAGLSNSRPRPLHLLPQAASTVLQSGLGSAIPNKVLHVSLLSPRCVGAVWPEQKQQAYLTSLLHVLLLQTVTQYTMLSQLLVVALLVAGESWRFFYVGRRLMGGALRAYQLQIAAPSICICRVTFRASFMHKSAWP